MWHNADIRPSYAIDSSGNGLWFNRNGLEAQQLKEQIIREAKEHYKIHCKARNKAFQAKSYEWSAVVNLKPDSTQDDLEALSKHFSEKYGFQCYQIAIHRDEGHINEQGEKIINHHAHLEFITLDKETGKNRFRGSLRTPKALSKMQDEVAQILQMKRGVDKRLSGAKRIEPRALAAIKEQQKREVKALKNELLSQKEVNARLEAERKASIGQGYTKEFYRDLKALTRQQYEKIEDLEKAIQENAQKHAKELESKAQENAQLNLQIQQMQNVLNAQEQKLRQEKENLKKEQDKIDRQKRELESTKRFLYDDSKDQIKAFFDNEKGFFTNDNKIDQKCKTMQFIVANIVDRQTQKLRNQNKELAQNLQEQRKELTQSNEKLNNVIQRISEKNEVLNKYKQEMRSIMSWEDYCKLTNTPNTLQEKNKFFGRETPQNLTKQRSR